MIDFHSPTGLKDVDAALGAAIPEEHARYWVGAVTVSAFECNLGCMIAGALHDKLLFLEFADPDSVAARMSGWRSVTGRELRLGDNAVVRGLRNEIGRYFSGELRRFRTRIEPLGTPFQLGVWGALAKIPFGETTTYGAMASDLGCPEAVRAVANANAGNRLAIVIPCHRVIGSNGGLTGYAGGLERKRCLLDHEARVVGRPVQARLF